MGRVVFIDSGGFGGDTANLVAAAARCADAAEVMRAAAQRARYATMSGFEVGSVSSWFGPNQASGATTKAWDVAIQFDELGARLEGLRDSFMLAADVYDRAEQSARGLVVGGPNAVGWEAEAKMAQVGQRLSPFISAADVWFRSSDSIGKARPLWYMPLPSFMLAINRGGIEHKAITARADHPVERSAAVLAKAYPRFEARRGMYHGGMRMTTSDGQALKLEWDRSEYEYDLKHFSTGIPGVLAFPAVRGLKNRAQTPRKPADLVNRVQELRDNPTGQGVENSEGSSRSGEFEIQRHDTPGRDRPSWSVVVRGTQEWFPGTSNPKDMQSNLALVGRVPTDEEAAILVALEGVGAEPGDTVEMVGHSQGGLVAGSLAATPAFTDRYNVAAVVTAGSPIQGMGIPDSTPVLSFEHTDDFVAGLDGQLAAPSKNHITVYSRGGGGFAHDLEGYVQDARDADAQGHSDLERWSQRRSQAMGFSEDTKTTQQRFTITRVKQDAGS